MEAVFEDAAISKRLAQGKTQIDGWVERLEKLHMLAEESHNGNPVQILGFQIYEEISNGQLDYDAIEQLIGHLSDVGFRHRLAQLKNFSSADKAEENCSRCKAVFAEIARQYDGDFAGFCEQLGKIRYGIVLTAHPTFSQSRTTQQMLCEFAAGDTISGAPLETEKAAKQLKKLLGKTHLPEENIDLALENEWSQQIIVITQNALRKVYGWSFEAAKQYFPNEWKNFKPALISIASWVGYDTDGRNDISWQTSFSNRLSASIRQLEIYRTQFQNILDDADGMLEGEALAFIEQSAGMIDTEYQARQNEMKLLNQGDIKIFGQKLHQRSDRLKNTDSVCALLDQAIALMPDNAVLQKLLVLNTEMRHYGLVSSQCHVRLNSVQLHNALWQILGLVGEVQENTTWRRYIRKLNGLFETVKPLTINFGVVDAETMNARRLMMLVRLMLDYVDDTTPIRFLLAECESPFTILCALYLARLFGVADKTTISPLFETPTGLAKGSDMVAHLLDNPYYRAWVEQIGLVPIEAGYSDAGRFSGQVTASLAIERMQIKLLQAMAARQIKADLLIFNTHGESVGRGGFPQNFSGRLDYLLSPQVRRLAEKNGIGIIHETSFQGSDGYTLLGTPRMALAIITGGLAHGFLPVAKKEDPFYMENDAALSFFQRIRRFNETLFNMPQYGDLLKMGHSDLIYKTGSRKRKRQHDAAYGINPNHPSQIRAIPHNTMLQQMGWLANSIGGIGVAISENKDWYWEMMQHSPRMRQIMVMVWYARIYSSHNAFYAYSELYNPDLWLRRAHLFSPLAVKDRRVQERVNELCRVAELLGHDETYANLSKIMRSLGNDSIDLSISLARTAKIWDEITIPFTAIPVHRHLLLLHTIRLALKVQCYHLAVKIPRFAPYFDVTHEGVLGRIFDFDITGALLMLEKIFPKESNLPNFAEYGNNPSYISAKEGAMVGSYAHLHEQIFEPLARIYDLLRQTGGVLTNFISAHG